MRRSLVLGSVLVLTSLTAAARAQDALETAKRVTGEGAKILSSKNVSAMMATFVEDARVSIVKRNESTGGLEYDTRNGKTEIQKLYEELFKTDGPIDARNNVEFARFIGNDLLLIGGTVEFTTGAQTHPFTFVQVRTRQGDKWLLTEIQVFLASAS